MMQNHYVISSKYHFWTWNVPNWTKSLKSDMSGPAKTCFTKYIYLEIIFLPIFCDFWCNFNSIFRFLVKITWFLSFSSKNDAESLGYFVKIPFLDLKRAKLDQKSEIGHVRTCQDLFLPSKVYIFYKIMCFTK